MPGSKALLAILLGGCSTVVMPLPGPVSGEQCVVLFQRYDQAKATMSTPSGRRDRMAIPPDLQRQVGDLQQGGCMTLSDELDLAVAGPPVVDGGAAITPVRLHAGVVTSQEDEAAVLTFFKAQGVTARSIGAAGLGRRIYLGPFATEGALESATGLALAAGFEAPYPADF